MTIKASELRSRLKKGGFGAEDAERIIKGEIDAGNAMDDGIGGSIPLDMLIEASAAVRDIGDPEEAERSNAINKGGAVLGEELGDMLRAAAVNTENLVDFQREALPALAKGTLAIGSVVEALVSTVAGLCEIMKGVDARLAAPVAPRGVAPGAKPLPHPSETLVKSEGAPKTLNRGQLHAALLARQSDMIEKGVRDDAAMLELDQIGKAIGALENSSAPLSAILRKYEIELG